VKIALIGWGYLIWDRRSLDIAPEWQADGPLLPVEFARFTLPPRLLPVLIEDAPLQPTFWTLSQKRSVVAAAADLAVRENVGAHDVGSWSRAESLRPSSGFEARIAQWGDSKGLDGAVWRAVGPNLPDRSPGYPSEQLRLEFLRGLVASGEEQHAKDYFERMPAQIRTPFQVLVEREFGWRSRPRGTEAAAS
jgi:hypothetical protein